MTERLLGTAHFWAHQLGISDKEVRKLVEGREPDGMRGQQPQFYLSSVYQAITQSGELDGGQERARKDKEAADKLALENAETRGELGRVPDVVEWFGEHVDRCCTRLDQIPDALGQLCEPRIAALIVPECRRLIYEARSELAADSAAGGASDPEPMAPASDGERERVGGQQPAPVRRKQRRAGAVAN